jgi:hypothetical protein
VLECICVFVKGLSTHAFGATLSLLDEVSDELTFLSKQSGPLDPIKVVTLIRTVRGILPTPEMDQRAANVLEIATTLLTKVRATVIHTIVETVREPAMLVYVGL